MRKFEKNKDEELWKKEKQLKEKVSQDYVSYSQMGCILLVTSTFNSENSFYRINGFKWQIVKCCMLS
jgi:hypothetical protein